MLLINFLCLVAILLQVQAKLPGNVYVNNLPNKRGIVVQGASHATIPQNAGQAVRALGDMNQDGVDDYAVGAYHGSITGRQLCGLTYVVYGSKSTFSNVDLGSLTASAGFQIIGEAANDLAGDEIGAADINGDGYKDIILGVKQSSPTVSSVARSRAGTTYVIFGKASRSANVDLAALSISDGFKIFGASSNDFSGTSVAGVGDLNKDGYEDFVVASPSATRSGKSSCGIVYVLFGKSSFSGNMDLNALTSAQGFQITGASANFYAGSSVSSAGDFNNDGFPDYAIGAFAAGTNLPGWAYVFFGKSSGFADIDLASFQSSASLGIKITGEAKGDQFGVSIASAEDYNGDGINDLVVGANFHDPHPTFSNAGAAYVLYGSTGVSADFNISSMTNAKGFSIYGAETNYNLGISVSAGDFDNDGLSDVLLGANQQAVNGTFNIGAAYVIAGKANAVNIFTSSWDSSYGFIIHGIAVGDKLGSSVDLSADINGDGSKDALVSAPLASPLSRSQAGAVYVIGGMNVSPTAAPTAAPTVAPSAVPTVQPTSSAPSFVPTAVPTMAPTQPTAVPTADPTNAPTAAPTYSMAPTFAPSANSLAPTAAPSANPTATPVPTAEPTFTPSAAPTEEPTYQPTYQPTFVPTYEPTYLPTFAPTLNTNAQLSYDLFMNFSSVKAPELSPGGVIALQLTIAQLTGLPASNIIFIRTVSATPENRLAAQQVRLRTETTSWTIQQQVNARIDLRFHPTAIDETDVLCAEYKNKLDTFVTNGTFVNVLKSFAGQVKADELSTVTMPINKHVQYTSCKVINNSTENSVKSNSASERKVANGVIAAICVLVLFFVFLCLCFFYVGIAYYREHNQEKVPMAAERDPNAMNNSAYSGISMSGDEFEMGDNTVMMFMSSGEDEDDADSYGFAPKKKQPRPVVHSAKKAEAHEELNKTNDLDLNDFNDYLVEEQLEQVHHRPQESTEL